MRRPALFLLAAATALLAGCGGGEGEDATAEVEERIVATVRSDDPADCDRYTTQKWLEQSSKLKGEAALRACEETASEDWPLPTRVNVTEVEVDGDRATARVAFEGGAYDGQTFDVALVEDDGWRLDELLRFEVLDREALILQWGRQLLEKARSAAEADVYSCMIGELEELDDAALESLILDPSIEPVLDLVRPCEPRSASA